MVDGINFNRPVGQSNGNSKDAPKIYRDSAPKVSIFTDKGQKPVANDSTTQGFQMFQDSAPILDGGDSTKTDTSYQLFRDSAPKLSSANSEEPTIDGGTLPEVEIVGKKPNKALANNTVPQDTQTAAPKHKKGFFAWFGKTFGFSKS